VPPYCPEHFYLIELKGGFGRGGGDRNDRYLNKECALNAWQPPSPAKWNKRLSMLTLSRRQMFDT
jgi:hypothetical protein